MDIRREPVVIVVGSANTDITVTTAHLPKPGETVLGNEVTHRPGGKGLNQAIAATFAGATVELVGAVGTDAASDAVVAALHEAGVGTAHLRRVSGATGTAHVVVDDDGRNQIVVVPAANAYVAADHVLHALAGLGAVDVVLVQGEIPAAAIAAAAEAADRAGARLVVNLAPVLAVPEAVIRHANPLVVNETEAGTLLGVPVPAEPVGAAAAAVRLAERSRSVVITLGALGAVVAGEEGSRLVSAAAVAQVVDTTGAGDAFVGVLSAELADGSPLVRAAAIAVVAATATVAAHGASTSYPAIREALRGARSEVEVGGR